MMRTAFSSAAVFVVIAMLFPAAARSEATSPKETTVSGLIDQLANPKLSSEKKSGLKEEIVTKGKEAIPVLIDHLSDRRVVRREDVQNYYNLPGNQPAPQPILANISVGDECKAMLYDIITPRYTPPSADLRGKPFSLSILSVPDWKAWWAKNKDKSLEQIHAELKPLVDRYWEQHGTEQVVP